MSKITLTLKDPKQFQQFFSKFSNLGSTVLGILYKDSLEVSGYFDDRSTYKKSKIYFKDVFEESEIEIEQPIFISLFSKVNKIISYLNNYSKECKFIISYEEMNSKSLVQLTQNYNNNFQSVLVVESITLKDSNLSLKMTIPRLSMSKSSFDMTKERFNEIITESETTQIYSKFILNKESKHKISSLIKAKSASDNISDLVSIGVSEEDKENIVISMNNYFDYKILISEYIKDFTFYIDPVFLLSIDDEEYMCNVYQNLPLKYIVFTSKESETISMSTAKTPGDE